MKIDFSVIVPVFNEFNLINQFTNNLLTTFKKFNVKYIFIDDGSWDGSKEWLTENIPIIYKNHKYDLILLNKNYGKGYAVRKGLKKIEGEYILFLDSDLEYEPQDGLELYQIALNNDLIDVIYGSRYLGGKIQLRKHFFNDIAVRINTYLFNILFNQSITDLHTGTKLIKSKLIKKFDLSLNRFGFEIDISSKIAKLNYNIYEYGISYIERSYNEGKKITLLDGILSYYFLFKTRFLENDITTSFSILYSFCFMTYAGTFFGMGLGKVLVVLLFMIIGLMIGIHRKIMPLSLIFLSMYIGSLFSKGNGRIYPIIIFFILSLIVSKRIGKKFKKKTNHFLLKFFI